MKAIAEIEARRKALLQELAGMRSLRRGTLNQQYFQVRRRGELEPVRRGPYYVLSRREGDRTVSRRVRPAEVERTRAEIAGHRRFRELCRELEALTERLGELERELAKAGREKKRRRSRSSRTRR